MGRQKDLSLNDGGLVQKNADRPLHADEVVRHRFAARRPVHAQVGRKVPALHFPPVAFAEFLDNPHRQAVRRGDDPGGVPGPRQRAGKDRADLLRPQDLGGRFGLPNAQFGQRNVDRPGQQAALVVFGLSVADEQERSGKLFGGQGRHGPGRRTVIRHGWRSPVFRYPSRRNRPSAFQPPRPAICPFPALRRSRVWSAAMSSLPV